MPDKHIVRSLSDAAILTSPQGVVTAWNQAATELFGWTEEEMVGRPLIERFPLHAREQVRKHLETLASGGIWDGEFEDYHRDGSRVWVEAHVRPVHDHRGVVTGILGISRSITAVRAAEIERDRHRRFAVDILDAMSAHVAVLDQDGLIRDVNRAWKEFACSNTPGGTEPPSTGIGVNYVALCRQCVGAFSSEALPAAEGIDEVLHGKRSYFVLEYPCDSPTESRWFAMQVTPLSNPDGGAVVAHYDITARKLAELQVASQNRRMELALNAAQMGVWRFDLATKRIEWSAEVYKVVGVDGFDGTLESWERMIHPADLPPMQARFQEAIARRMPFTGDFRIVRPSGEIRWLANVGQVECDPSGEVLAVVGTVQDVSAQKRSEWALTAYNRILERIAAGTNLHQILEEVVRLVEEQLPGSLCSVLIVDPTTKRLRFGAGGSLPEEYNRAIDGVPIGPKVGSCGTAVHRKATVTVTDISTDPLWEDYRELALHHGLKSCVSVPILSSGNVPGLEKGAVIGTFALYNRVAGDFDRITYAILSGAEQLVRRAIQSERPTESGPDQEQEPARVIEATHLAGVAIERDQAVHAVRESEERFRAILDSAPSAVYVKDLDGRFLFVNRAMAELFGVPLERWVGKTSKDVMPPELAAVCDRCDQHARQIRESVTEHHVCQLPTGREATILATHFLLYRADFEPYAVCGTLRDMSDLVAAQREFERLWMHAPDPLCVAGFDGYFKQVNPVWSRLLGWTDEELLRTPYSHWVHTDDLAGMTKVEQRLLKGETIRGYENRYRCRDGSYRWFSWNAIPVLENKLIYGITRDVTEEKRLAEQFRQAQKMEAVGQLASGVAHDFNNLLTIINGYTDLLLAGMPSTDSLHEPLTEVLTAGKRAADLTSQLLAFARKAIVEPRVLDVNRVVEASVRMLRRIIGEQVRLETKLSDIPPVRIDPGQLDQVFMNLAVNARDAMPRGGRLTISTEVVAKTAVSPAETGELGPGLFVRIRVSDTGIGMTPEVRARLFEPFFTTKGPGRGTGLGLATVYGIVRQAGGAISVETEPGAGTTFEILFPAVVGDPKTTPTSSPGAMPGGTETVLVAEDEDGVREVVRQILGRLGYTVHIARTQDEAVRMLSDLTCRVDLLLTDVVMPDVGGRELADLARRHRPGIRVLFMSGYTDDLVLLKGVGEAQAPFIQKPFAPRTLARRVRETLDTTTGSRS